jgi:hypothetical protein
MLLLGGVVIAPRALQAQQKPMPVVGYLRPAARHPLRTSRFWPHSVRD